MELGNNHEWDDAEEYQKPKGTSRQFLFLQGLTTLTIFLSLFVSFTFYRQSQDRKVVRELAVTSRQRACDLYQIRRAVPAETERDKATDMYDRDHPVICNDIPSITNGK